MEAENASAPSSWSSETNWTVADGSLVNSITLESLVSPIDESTVSTRKSHLLLRPSSPHSGPCDIKISFSQKYEVRQVYVRSTARVYEIYESYCTPKNMQSSNEYLCTVRCGLAAKQDMLHATEGEGELSNGSSKQLDEKSKSDRNISTCEDDWVDVKGPDSPNLDRTNNSLSSKSDMNSGRAQQNFYEATAEITDAEPCTSLILRMLSLSDKENIYVDEIYVFADPVDSAESDDQQSRVENSAGSSLLAMLVPTLLQLSKAGKGQVQDKNTFDTRNEQRPQQIGSEGTESTNSYNKHHVEGNSNNADRQEVKVEEHIPTRIPDIDSNPDSTAKEKDFPYSCLERAMDQLVSRVSRIEDIYLRFEESMLKPICSIEARLERVEQQLEILIKNSQCSGFTSGTRFSAPEFSCVDSGSSSFYNEANDYPSVGASRSVKRDIPFGKFSIPPDEMSAPVSGTELVRGLVLSAPEFSNIDDEVEIYCSEPEIDSARDKPKEAVSIDDALASALAGFISSTSIHLQHYTQALAVKAPEFSNDDDGNDDIVASPRIQCEIAKDPSLSSEKPFVSSDKTDVTECEEGFVLSPCSVASFENKHAAMNSLKNDYIEDGTEGFDEECQENGGGEGDDRCHVLTPAKNEVEDSCNRQISKSVSEIPISDNIVIPSHPSEAPTNDSSSLINEGSTKDILQKILLEFSRSSPVLDFEAPILDVMFNNSQENSITKSPLEALLANTAEFSVEDPPCVEKSDDGTTIDDKCNLTWVEDGEAIGTATGNDILGDMFHYELEPVASNTDGEDIQSCYYSCSSQEVSATNLI